MNTLVKDEVDEFYPYIAHLLNIKLDSRYEAKVKYLEPEVMKVQTHLAIATLLRAYALKEPCVYVFDDLYLADMSLLEALKFFLETSTNVPMLVFLLSRPHKASAFWDLKEKIKPKLDLHEMHLRRLNSKETKEISKNLLHIPKLPVTLLNDMVVKADGNPFFLEEIIKLLIAEGILYKKGDEWYSQKSEIEFSIPYTIEAIIRNRFDMLSSSLRGTLEEMAVVGRTFPKKILRAFSTKWEHLDDFIGEITELGFVTTENEEDYQFNHALVREVIYSSIPEKRKKALHLKVGETIEALYKDRLPEFYEILFEHFSQTEQHEKTIDYGLKAAENAQKRYANYEAILMYCAVLKELGTLGGNEAQRRQVLIALGKIHNRIGKSDDAFEFYQQALQHCANDLQEAEIYRYIADNYYTISDYNNALESYNKALDKISDPKSLKHYGVQLGIAWVQYLQGEYEKPRVLLVSILDQLADTTDLETRTIQARIYNILASIYTNLDKQSTSFEYYNKALKLYEILDDISGQAVIYNNMCGYYDDIGDHHKALENLEKSLEIETQTGNMLGQAITTYNIGNTYYLLGDFDKAAENFNSYMSLNASINNHLGNGYGNWGFGLISMQQDDYAKAFKYLNKAFSIFKELKSARMETDVKMTIAELNYLQKRYADSWNMCEDIIKCCKESQTSDMIRQARLLMAKIRIAQAIENKKLSITFFDEAKKILIDLLASITDPQEAKEEQFEIQACLTRVCYYLGISEDMMKYLSKAEAIQKELVQFMPDQSSREKFLSRRMYREFNQFRTETQL
jgi:predicted ATPase